MKRAISFVSVLVAFTFVTASATIINIPGDYPAIQQGIDASTDGDTVLVQPRTYVENINFSGHNIVLGSLFLTTGDTSYISTTIIDGDSSGSVVTFSNGEDRTAMLVGFTIKHGYASRGGGIYCQDSSPTISDNIITENTAAGYYGYGGGISCKDSSPLIINNIIRNNEATEWDFGDGGGIECSRGSPVISNNLIVDNQAWTMLGLGTGGIACSYTSALVINNTVCNNFIWGISFSGDNNIAINNIVWNNSDQICGQASVTYCDIMGGWQGEGNIDCDPMFCDAENGNYYLDIHSCCIGAGESGADIGAYGVGCSTPMILNVPDDYPTIQAAIDACIQGDTVLVQPGTYVENINFNGQNIIVGSLFMMTGDTLYISSTIIDGNSSGSVVTFESGEDSTAVINGFKIQNGYDEFGGGIFCESSNPVIENNIVRQNSAVNGGGIHCGNSYLTLINNIIIENTAENGGAGIDNIGGAPALFGCTISANNAGDYGGGISNDMCSPIIANCVITNNTTAGAGGGISNYTFSQAIFINCTFSDNSAGYGGAIWNGASTPTLVNCILWGDTPDEFSGDQSIVSYSDIQGGWEGEGNIDTDPLFRDVVNGDYHLMSISCGYSFDSPCIDAGHPFHADSILECAWGLGTIRSDMGAYGGVDSLYFPDCIYIPGDVNHNGVALEMADVLAMIATYRGSMESFYDCTCGADPPGPNFAATADPNGNCVANELNDAIIELRAYRGAMPVSGCPDCPGSEGRLMEQDKGK